MLVTLTYAQLAISVLLVMATYPSMLCVGCLDLVLLNTCRCNLVGIDTGGFFYNTSAPSLS